MGDAILVSAVKVAKRSREYRQFRSALACVTPVEVWRDPTDASKIFVTFEVARPADAILGFVLDGKATRLEAASILTSEITESDWRITNNGLPDAGDAPASDGTALRVRA